MASSSALQQSFSLIGCPVIEKLGKGNFPLWSAQVLSALRGVQIAHYLEPDIVVPAKQMPTEVQVNEQIHNSVLNWEKQVCYFMVIYEREYSNILLYPCVSRREHPKAIYQKLKYCCMAMEQHNKGMRCSTNLRTQKKQGWGAQQSLGHRKNRAAGTKNYLGYLGVICVLWFGKREKTGQ